MIYDKPLQQALDEAAQASNAARNTERHIGNLADQFARMESAVNKALDAIEADREALPVSGEEYNSLCRALRLAQRLSQRANVIRNQRRTESWAAHAAFVDLEHNLKALAQVGPPMSPKVMAWREEKRRVANGWTND